jgi:hypothetical protein
MLFFSSMPSSNSLPILLPSSCCVGYTIEDSWDEEILATDGKEKFLTWVFTCSKNPNKLEKTNKVKNCSTVASFVLPPRIMNLSSK